MQEQVGSATGTEAEGFIPGLMTDPWKKDLNYLIYCRVSIEQEIPLLFMCDLGGQGSSDELRAAG